MDVAHCYLDGNADAVEFCRHDSFHQILAASTYTLLEDTQPKRSGSISLFSVDADVGHLKLLHRMDTTGIFDIKWNPVGVNVFPFLAQADSDGYLRIHRLDETEVGGNVLREYSGEKVSSSMCLCLDWNPSATSISVGLSDGSVSVITLNETKLEIEQAWEAHEYEVWAASFDTHQPQLVYTGSDDCKFSCWDLRDSPSTLAFQNRKTHQMGICCIAKSPWDRNKLLTGSYDEYLRVWDVRSISKPVTEISICLGGGVWRIKHHPSIPGLILAACMHNGFAVVKITRENVELVETYNKHESLAYGVDWQREGSCEEGRRKGRSVVASCSFYDRLLRVWKPNNEVNYMN